MGRDGAGWLRRIVTISSSAVPTNATAGQAEIMAPAAPYAAPVARDAQAEHDPGQPVPSSSRVVWRVVSKGSGKCLASELLGSSSLVNERDGGERFGS